MEPQVVCGPQEQREARKPTYAEMAARNAGSRKFTPGKAGVQGASAPKVAVATSAGPAAVKKHSQPFKLEPKVVPTNPAHVSKQNSGRRKFTPGNVGVRGDSAPKIPVGASAVVEKPSQPLKLESKVVPMNPAPVTEKPALTSDAKFDGQELDQLQRDPQNQAAKNQENVDLKQECMLTISLSEFQSVLDNKNKIISDLEKQKATLLKKKNHEDQIDLISPEKEDQQKKLLEENVALKDEIKKAKLELSIQKSVVEKETYLLYDELRKKDEFQKNTSRKVTDLEAAVSAEKTRAKDAEVFLARKDQETSKLNFSLIQMREDMRQQRCQWEQDKSRLLSEQVKTVIDMKSAVRDTQKVLEDEMQRWQKEKSLLLETITTLKDNVKKAEDERKTTVELFMDRINNLAEQLENLQKPKKKKSLKERFLQMFRRS